jgi:multiple sugar transport system substrate-binding protein
VASDSPHAEAAWQLVEFLTDPEQQLAFYRLTGDLPARRSAWSAGALTESPRVQAFWRQLEHVRTPPKIPEWERIAATISRYAEAAVRGDLTLDEALIGLDRDVDRILEKRRWLLKRQASAVSYQPSAAIKISRDPEWN